MSTNTLARAPVLRHVLSRLKTSAIVASGLSDAERRALRQLVRRGFAQRAAVVTQAEPPPAAVAEGPRLTVEQQAALDALLECGAGFHPWLLHGVTGSGKTEVYFRAMAHALASGGQVLFLVPEIGLTPQLETRMRARFPGHALVTLHSSLAPGERSANWIAAHTGAARIVLGTRSAVFTPLPRLALIVVDEEHDSSFKQIESMRYSARDLAVWRARQRDVPVILGSATPALESFHGAMRGRYRLARLTSRANAQPLPRVTLVTGSAGRAASGLAPQMINAIRACLDRAEQALVFINRRGYSPVLVCSACGWAPECTRCAAHLVLHKSDPQLACHHCGHAEPIPRACARCGNVELWPVGYGTQRIETALKLAFPAARLLRIDRDTIRGRNTWNDMRLAIERRDVDILLGTQLLSKGHDFPGLALVCVLNADRSLYSTDFRATEQLFAQITQVAGRAGRGSVPGEVLIQTAYPHHPIYRAVMTNDYEAFAHALLAEREAAGLPPFVFQAVLRAEARTIDLALDFLRAATQRARGFSTDVAIFDPTPAVMQRLRGLERAQVLVQAPQRPVLQRFLGQWTALLRESKSGGVRWALDVDPLDI